MLPGFRFLFAAIVLSLSILVFGLGAAALLRAAHEEFASTPAWRGAPEMVFAQPVETRPVLALLRVDTPVAEKVADTTPADAVPPAITPAPAEPERIAALKPEDSPSPETAKPEATVAESPARDAAASAPVEPPAETRTAETKIAMSEDIASPANQAAAPAASEPSAPPTSPEATIAATKIATLGGPAVSIETPRPVKAEGKKADSAKTDSIKTGSNIIKKRQHARRAARRRLAARARLTAQLPLQQADPFGQPAPTIVRRR